MKFNRAQIHAKAIELLSDSPNGLRYSEIIKGVHEAAPETPFNSVRGGVHNFLSTTGKAIQLGKGLWQLAEFANSVTVGPDSSQNSETFATSTDKQGKAVKLSESDFYAPFAKWLKEEADEVTESMELGGAIMKNKWGTPDVVGVYKPRNSDFIKFPIEIVSAKIKLDPGQSVTAFGQACAYRLFSHKAFVVMPDSIPPDDRNRLEALCALYGVGLVVFALDPENPQFKTVVIPQRAQPDMFYANQFARRLHDISKEDFDRLF